MTCIIKHDIHFTCLSKAVWFPYDSDAFHFSYDNTNITCSLLIMKIHVHINR